MKLNLKKLAGIGLAVILATSGGGCFGNSIFNPVEIVYATDTQLAIDYQFNSAGDFSEGLARVYNASGNKYGFIDTSGNLVIDYQFYSNDLGNDLDRNFSEGLARVYNPSTKKYGYIDKTGKLVIDYQFDFAWDFSEGLAPVQKSGKYGYIDETGKLVIDYQFENAGNFSEGLAPVKKSGKYGYIDKTGELVIDYQFESAGDFSEGLALVSNYEKFEQKFGYVDKTGKLVIDYQFEIAGDFSEGLAYVGSRELWLYGYIDKTGELVIDYQFGNGSNFSEGLACVWIRDDLGKYDRGYIDKTGELVIDYQFENAGDFSEGLAAVQKSGKYGYIDKTGELVIDYQFESAGDFSEGLARVSNGSKSGYISKESTEASRISVILDGEKIAFSQDPVIENGYTLVPMRTIFEKLGASVEWDANTKTVTATKGGTVIKLTVGNNVATVNGNSYNLDVSPKILNGTTLVPVRFVSEQLNVNVEWDANTRNVTMTSK